VSKLTLRKRNDLPNKYAVGKHIFKWDGFDNNGIYASTSFLNGQLKARIKGRLKGKERTAESEALSFEYKEVEWVDTKIDKNAKRIDITLRVNLKDGGENGTDKDCYELGKTHRAPIIDICPWDKIPKGDLISGTPIKTRTKSFADLKKLVLSGLNKYWSRNKGNTGNGVDINGEQYEVFVNAINTTKSKRSLDDIPLIYNTNNSWSRSGNTGGTYDDGNPSDEIMNILPNGLIQRISYNVGYIKYTNGWFYQNQIDEDKEFEETAAHEIGHEILQALYSNLVFISFLL